MITALLSACGGDKGVVVKAPKFAKQGKEVEAAQFIEDFSKVVSELPFLQENAELKSRKLVAKGSFETKETYKYKDQLMAEDHKKEVEEGTYVIDAKNLVVGVELNSATERVNKDPWTEVTTKGTEKNIFTLQEGELEDKNCCLMVNKTNKEVSPMTEITEASTMKDIILSVSVEAAYDVLYLAEAASLCESYATMTDAQKACYKFYENKNIYTVEFADEYTEGSKEDSIYKGKMTQKMQYEIKEGNLAFRLSSIEEETIETFVTMTSSPNYLAGDYRENRYEQYIESVLKDGKYTAKPLDYSDYTIVHMG